MKKIFISFLIIPISLSIILGSSAFAAKKYVTISQLRMGLSGIVGLNQALTYLGPNTLVALLFSTEQYKGKLGLNYQSANQGGNSDSIFTLLTSHEWRLSTANKLSPHAGLVILYSTDANYGFVAGRTSTSLQIGPYYGYTYEALENFEISLDFMPFAYLSAEIKNVSNTSAFNFLGKAFISANYYF